MGDLLATLGGLLATLGDFGRGLGDFGRSLGDLWRPFGGFRLAKSGVWGSGSGKVRFLEIFANFAFPETSRRGPRIPGISGVVYRHARTPCGLSGRSRVKKGSIGVPPRAGPLQTPQTRPLQTPQSGGVGSGVWRGSGGVWRGLEGSGGVRLEGSGGGLEGSGPGGHPYRPLFNT